MPFLLHQSQCIGFHKRAVLDRINAGVDRFLGRFIAVTMDRDFFPQPVRFIDQRRHLGRRELRHIDFVGQREHAAGDGSLDHIGAIFHLEPNRFPNRVRSVGNAVGPIRLCAEKHVAKSVRMIEMTAGRADAVSRDEHARSGDDAFVDRVAERDIGKVVRIGKAAPDVAHGGEAGFDRGFGIRDHLERELGNIFVQHAETQLVVVAGIIEGQMGVRVHEAGREGGVAEIDDLGVVGNGDVAPGGGDGVALRSRPRRSARAFSICRQKDGRP